MTEQEAKALVEWFKARKGKTLKLNDNGIDCVVEALEKQIPKKPIYKKGFFNAWRCPICDEIVGESQNYCNSCGQKLWEQSNVLDWGNEDAE